MTTIVYEHFPVVKLPDELRAGLDREGLATISVTLELPTAECEMSLEDIFALSQHSAKRSAEEIDAEIRALRAEWEERG